jgi:hypothetical protein
MKYMLALFASVAVAQVKTPLDVCRVTVGFGMERVHCQHFRSGGKTERIRSIKTIDSWMAVPCKQLKKYEPTIDCSPRAGFVKLGQAQSR